MAKATSHPPRGKSSPTLTRFESPSGSNNRWVPLAATWGIGFLVGAVALVYPGLPVVNFDGPGPAGSVGQPEVVDDRAVDPRGPGRVELAGHHPEHGALGLAGPEDLLQPGVGHPADHAPQASLAAAAH